MSQKESSDPLSDWLVRRERRKWIGLLTVVFLPSSILLWSYLNPKGVPPVDGVDQSVGRGKGGTSSTHHELKSPSPIIQNETNPDCDAVCEAMEVLDEARLVGRRCPDGSRFPPSAPYDWDDELADAAQQQAQFLAEVGYLSHDTPDSEWGQRVSDRVEHIQDLEQSGEVLYRGSAYGRNAMSWWLQSAEHCRLLMRPDMNAMGLESARGDQGVVWVGLVGQFH